MWVQYRQQRPGKRIGTTNAREFTTTLLTNHELQDPPDGGEEFQGPGMDFGLREGREGNDAQGREAFAGVAREGRRVRGFLQVMGEHFRRAAAQVGGVAHGDGRDSSASSTGSAHHRGRRSLRGHGNVLPGRQVESLLEVERQRPPRSRRAGHHEQRAARSHLFRVGVRGRRRRGRAARQCALTAQRVCNLQKVICAASWIWRWRGERGRCSRVCSGFPDRLILRAGLSLVSDLLLFIDHEPRIRQGAEFPTDTHMRCQNWFDLPRAP